MRRQERPEGRRPARLRAAGGADQRERHRHGAAGERQPVRLRRLPEHHPADPRHRRRQGLHQRQLPRRTGRHRRHEAGRACRRRTAPTCRPTSTRITSICNLQTPDQSKFYLQATTLHGGGKSAVVSAIEAATHPRLDPAGGQERAAAGGVPRRAAPTRPTSTSTSSPTEIQPILFGTLDLNDPHARRAPRPAARAPAATATTAPAARWSSRRRNAPAQNLQNFACFVNLANPTASPLLLLPAQRAGLPEDAAPGSGRLPRRRSTDLNYQRILSYIYGSKTASTPLDFAFFARQINTIFNDVNAVQNGAQNRTCADTTSCHGIQTPGQRPPNGSIFAVLANAGDKTSQLYNFAAAANFTNFVTPSGSSLFLFPTDEIANLANPFATGLHHPGGLDFAVDSPQAQRHPRSGPSGLRPDGSGFVAQLARRRHLSRRRRSPTPPPSTRSTSRRRSSTATAPRSSTAASGTACSRRARVVDLNQDVPAGAEQRPRRLRRGLRAQHHRDRHPGADHHHARPTRSSSTSASSRCCRPPTPTTAPPASPSCPSYATSKTATRLLHQGVPARRRPAVRVPGPLPGSVRQSR